MLWNEVSTSLMKAEGLHCLIKLSILCFLCVAWSFFVLIWLKHLIYELLLGNSGVQVNQCATQLIHWVYRFETLSGCEMETMGEKY